MNPSISRWLSNHLLDRKGGHRRAVLDAWQAKRHADFVSPDERRAQQSQRLADLLNHARAKVPFYQSLLSNADEICALNAFEILRSLPIVTRADLQKNPEKFTAAGETATANDATGGSTGTPMRFKVDRATQIARESSLMWADNLAGWYPGERIAMLWGCDRDVRCATRTFRLTLRWWIENRRWFDAFQMDASAMHDYHVQMTRFRPHYLIAYANVLRVFAEFLEGEGLRPGYPLNAIISSAEVLTKKAREMAERVFGRPVFDRYGNREFGAMAAECREHGGLHANPSDMIFEMIPVDGTGGLGRIVVTYLPNRVMPFIRYDTGDLGRWTDVPCACGRTTGRFLEIAGRQSDIIRLPSGRMIHGEFFTHLFYDAKEVRSFQFVQETPTNFVLYVEATPEGFEAWAPIWRQRVQSVLDPESRLEVVRVDNIPPTASGKRRFTISKV